MQVRRGRFSFSFCFWYVDVSKNRAGPPKWMVKIMENPQKMDDLGGFPIIFGNTHVFQVNSSVRPCFFPTSYQVPWLKKNMLSAVINPLAVDFLFSNERQKTKTSLSPGVPQCWGLSGYGGRGLRLASRIGRKFLVNFSEVEMEQGMYIYNVLVFTCIYPKKTLDSLDSFRP